MLNRAGPDPTPGLVSVIMIFLDGEEFMEEAIDSVLGQSYRDFEILLCDDGSTDRSSAIAAAYAQRHPGRVRVLEHPGHVNKGMSATRNLGLAEARGEFLAFIDADDVWLERKLAEQVQIMQANPTVGMLCGKVLYWRSWEEGKDYLVFTGNRPGLVNPPEALEQLYPLGLAASPCPSDVMFRTAWFRRIGGAEEMFRGLYEDQAYFVKIFLEAPVYFADNIWLKYRQHRNSCSSLTRRSGRYEQIRRDFMFWFKDYLERKAPVDPRASAALRRAMRRYDYPLLFHAVDFTRYTLRRVSNKLRKMVLRREADEIRDLTR